MSFDFISMINYKFVNITNRERKRDAKMNRLVKNFVRDAGEIVLLIIITTLMFLFFLSISPFH